MSTKPPSRARVAALVGPYLSGKTSLLESILSVTETIKRKGNVKEANMVGDGSPEAKARQMSTELNIAQCSYLDEPWTFIDCPGSIELGQDARNALMIADTAIVICEADPNRALTIAPILKYLDQHAIPHLIFINKMDVPGHQVRATLEALQAVSEHPLVLREIPIRDGDRITGHVDLASERAFEWRQGDESKLIEIPDAVSGREQQARTDMLESLADFDDELLENLLEDVIPSSKEIYENLSKDLAGSLIVPVFFGSAENDNGVRRLLKSIRHETPDVSATANRMGLGTTSASAAVVFKTLHAGHVGKLSIARIMSGDVKDGMTLNGTRVSGLNMMLGQKYNKTAKVTAGQVVAMGRMEGIQTGDVLSEKGDMSVTWPDPLMPLFSHAIHAEQRSDDVKLSGALNKLAEEDPSVSWGHDADTNELLLWGQGEIHLLIANDKLKSKYNLQVSSSRPLVPYKETIQKSVTQHARHKKQSGGHGEFGDVHLEIKPLPRGSGFEFSNVITGGVVPKNYIPSVEHGVKEFMDRGPLGFQVVDIGVTLTDGQHHAVDSSDMAFKKAAAQAMREGTPQCSPVLLEPLFDVNISLPNEFTSGLQRLVSGRRGQILSFDAKSGWDGWDEINVQLPQSEMHDLIIELRSMTMGVGTFDWRFERLQEFSGKEAQRVISDRKTAHNA